jgi:Xaa-Pro aminopeptidase
MQTGRGARLPAGLKQDLDQRVAAVQAVMRDAGTDLLIAACAGAPGQAGWVRYLTGAPLWGPRTFVVVAANEARRTLVTRAPDDTNWYRLTAIDTDIESTLTKKITPLDGLLAMIRARLGSDGRLGVVSPEIYSPLETAGIRALVPESRIVDLTRQLWNLRQKKTAFEIRAMRRTGTLLAAALDRFESIARPGGSALEAAGALDAYFRSHGSPGGYVRYAFNQDPVPAPAVGSRQFGVDDVVLVHLAYAGPLGYWGELSSVFSFRPLAPEVRQRVEISAKALRSVARAIRPGRTRRDAGNAADRAYRTFGVAANGRHGPDLHTIGTDEDEDWSNPDRDGVLEQGMPVAVHPAPVLADGRGFFLARTYVVGATGARALSPSRPPHRQIQTP